MAIASWNEWKENLKQQVSNLKDLISNSNSAYQVLFLICFTPIFESDELPKFLDLISSEPLGFSLAQRIWNLHETARGRPDPLKLSKSLYKSTLSHIEEFTGADLVFSRLDILSLIQASTSVQENTPFFKNIIEEIREFKTSSALRVQCEILISNHVLPRFNDGKYVEDVFSQKKAHSEFIKYIKKIQSSLGNVLFERILPGSKSEVKLDDVYIPLNVLDNPYLEQIPDFTGAEEFDNLLPSRSAIEILSIVDHLVIVGAPGSGKSTFARNLAVRLAQAYEKNTGQKTIQEIMGTAWLYGSLFPIYIELRSFVDSSFFPRDEQDASYKNVVEYFKSTFGTLGSIFCEVWLNDDDSNNDCDVMLILDGLDEVSVHKDKRYLLKQVIESCSTFLKKTKILVTSRTHSYLRDEKWRLGLDFRVAVLAPLTMTQIENYVFNWYSSTFGRASALFLSKTEIDRKSNDLARNFINKINVLPHLKPLAQSPLLLALLTLIHASGKGSFPEGGRAELYEQTIRLLNRWDPPYERPSLVEKLEHLNLQRLRDALQILAFNTHRDQDGEQGTAFISQDMLQHSLDLQQIEKVDRGLGADTEAVIEYLKNRNGILVSPDEESFHFPHRSFQEFLAACALREQYDECQIILSDGKSKEWEFPENIYELLTLDFDKWREVAVLLGARLVAQRSIDDFWVFLDRLTLNCVKQEVDSCNTRMLFKIGLLGGDIWAEHKIEPRANKHRVVLERVRVIMKKIIFDHVLTMSEINRAGMILSIVGDDREGTGVNDRSVPEFNFIKLQKSVFLMGNDESSDEHPQHKVHILNPIELSIYPVTNKQYNAFIIAEDGYRNPKWWNFSQEAHEWYVKESGTERMRGEIIRDISNCPVVEVNWFEAVAFCLWISKKTGSTIRLPAESEWEYSARGIDGRKFPWGNEFDPNKCNMIETGLGVPSTVGIFDNSGPFGIFDMCGNVEEWCLTSWTEIAAYPYNPTDGRNELSGNSPRVVRGGSYISQRKSVTTTSRPGASVDRRTRYIGFRVLREVN